MTNIELLAPAGDFDCLIAAVENGCNAVYLSGTMYGARAFARNFNNDELKEAVNYCHIRNAKVYVTVNTLYRDEQFNDLIKYLDFLYEINVDALIIQDMGVVKIVKVRYPKMEIHISTQASVHNLEGVKYFEELGVERVVLARENNLKEIKNICKNTKLDIEVFVHGALCISCSGQCLMSSFIAKRSGNKGECGQPCRLPYNLIEDSKTLLTKDFLLSPKDLCSIDNVQELINAGIHSFKIEGRMKDPEYVAIVIRSYRQAIDDCLNHQSLNTNDSINKMKQVFNRGFTDGLLNNNFKDLITHNYSGNIGTFVGIIKSYNHSKRIIQIQLEKRMSQGDRILFNGYDFTRTITKLEKDGLLVNHANAGDLVSIELDKPIKVNTKIYKIVDTALDKEIRNSYHVNSLKLPISFTFSANVDGKPSLTVQNEKVSITYQEDFLIPKAKNDGMNEKQIIKQLSKVGDTCFKIDSINIDIGDNLFIPNSVLNKLRREALSAFEDKLLSSDNIPINKEITLSEIEHEIRNLDIKIYNKEQLSNIDFDRIDRIYYYHKINIDDLKKKYNNDFIPFYEHWDEHNEDGISLVSDFGNYSKDAILNYNFNIYNSMAANNFKNEMVLSLEMSKKQINNLKTDNQITMIAYSKIKNMTLRHCLISDYYFHDKKEHCNKCKNHNYSLIDRKNEKFDIFTDDCCTNYLLNAHRLYIRDLNNLKVDRILLEFHNENKDEVENIVNDFHNIIFKNTKKSIKLDYPITNGYYYEKV